MSFWLTPPSPLRPHPMRQLTASGALLLPAPLLTLISTLSGHPFLLADDTPTPMYAPSPPALRPTPTTVAERRLQWRHLFPVTIPVPPPPSVPTLPPPVIRGNGVAVLWFSVEAPRTCSPRDPLWRRAAPRWPTMLRAPLLRPPLSLSPPFPTAVAARFSLCPPDARMVCGGAPPPK